MFKTFIPFAKAKSIYDIDINFFTKLGITTILADLDNTLDSYKLYTPSDRAYEFKKKLDDANIELIIISNNHGKRVSSYANKLGVSYLANAKKPLPYGLKRLVKERKLDKNNIIFVGDQIMTDVFACKNAGIRIVLTDKIVKEDQWTTRINRLFGNRIRNYHIKHNNFIDWRDIYGKC